MPDRIDLGMNVIGEDGKSPFFDRPLTLERVHSWIRRHDIEEPVVEELVLLVNKYPNSALSSFVKNFDTHLGKARENATKR
jgi:hypothetical protein